MQRVRPVKYSAKINEIQEEFHELLLFSNVLFNIKIKQGQNCDVITFLPRILDVWVPLSDSKDGLILKKIYLDE